jgi:hypothetical protein
MVAVLHDAERHVVGMQHGDEIERHGERHVGSCAPVQDVNGAAGFEGGTVEQKMVAAVLDQPRVIG